MPLYFITGNKKKFDEVKAILPEVEQLDIDLPELQELDPHAIIDAKLQAARQHHDGEFIVEDTSLYLECLNGLPGPLIKWFLQTIGGAGLYKICQAYGNVNAKAKTVIGYADVKGNIEFFEGEIEGRIAEPRENSGFGWDPVFVPNGYDRTFAQMGAEEKNKISMRSIATRKLKEHRHD